MTAQKLRVGIIGIGSFAVEVHVPELRATGRAEVVAACRRDARLLTLAQQELHIPEVYTDWREMIAHTALDAVVVCTPHNLHREPTLAALERGLHVLLEKPIATTVVDAQAIVAAAHKSGRVVMVGTNARGMPSWRALKRVLAAGQIGTLRQVSARIFFDGRIFRQKLPIAASVLRAWSQTPLKEEVSRNQMSPDTWRSDPEQMGGDMFIDVGAHHVDILLWLAGAPAAEVVAFIPNQYPARAAIITAQARLTNGVIASITFNDNIALGDEFAFRGNGGLAVCGDGGVITGEWTSFGGDLGAIWVEQNDKRQQIAIDGDTISIAAAFVATILDGAPNIAPVDDAAQAVAFIQGAYQSASEGRVVAIE
jgi:UDP-N-acetylglucosamine 3-dehydrogenase